MYVFVYMYACLYIPLFSVYVYEYAYIPMCMHMYEFVYVYACLCIHLCVCMHIYATHNIVAHGVQKSVTDSYPETGDTDSCEPSDVDARN